VFDHADKSMVGFASNKQKKEQLKKLTTPSAPRSVDVIRQDDEAVQRRHGGFVARPTSQPDRQPAI